MKQLPSSQGRIVVMLQGLASHGGIQRHSRTLCKALTAYADTRAVTLDMLSFTDPDGWYDERYLAQPLRGCNGKRAHFVARALAALARPYDLAIVGQIDFGPITLLPHLLRPHAPILAMTYGIEVWCPLPLHKWLGLRIADQVTAISTYTAEKLVAEQGLDQGAVRLMPCTMDPDFLAAVAAWQASGQASIPTRLLTVSRMNAHDTDKGIDCVIRALPKVRAHVPDLSYTIIGDGEDRPRLEALARACGVAELVHFAGRVPDAQLHAYLSGTDVFLLPSRKEGFGIVFLEAMVYGKPVIAGAHGGSPEVVLDGETGLLVQHGDHHALAQAIISLLVDPQRRRAMGEAGRRRVQSVYDYRRFEAALSHTLDTLTAIQNLKSEMVVEGDVEPGHFEACPHSRA